MRYLLDTNVIIAAMKGAAPVVSRMETLPASALILSSIVLAELEHGAEKACAEYPTRLTFGALLLVWRRRLLMLPHLAGTESSAPTLKSGDNLSDPMTC